MPQSGTRSVLVEHGAGPNSLEPPLPLVSDDLSERMSPPALPDEQIPLLRPLLEVTDEDMNFLSENMQTSLFEYEQQLGFLRYLVQQGVVNEGFAEGQIPTQYQSKPED
jgi:hypothetical protein